MTSSVNQTAKIVVNILGRSKYEATSEFKSAWRTFVEATLVGSPEVDISGLMSLCAALGAGNLFREKLFLYSYIVKLLPESSESHCHLAYAYRDCGHFDMALKHFEMAIAFAWKPARERDLVLHDAVKQDIASYVRNAALMECQLGRPEAAYMRMIEANDLLKGHHLIQSDVDHCEEVMSVVMSGLGLSEE